MNRLPEAAPAAAHEPSDRDFAAIRCFLQERVGIALNESKRAMVTGRLSGRLRELGVTRFGDYVARLAHDAAEAQVAVDLLTTNETFFFREPRHFDFLSGWLAENRRRDVRVWSAASSTGEEAYSIAMVLADLCGAQPWTVVGTDISSTVLATARRAQYPMQRLEQMPAGYLQRFCLKGVGPHAGTFRVGPELRSRVTFRAANLLAPPADLGPFDLVFLRNVLIYFNVATKATVVNEVARRLRPGGHLLVGHSESLAGIAHGLEAVQTSIFRRPELG